MTRHKYGAKPVRLAGRYYASRAEADFMAELRLREVAGDVTDVVEQPRVEIERGVFYRADGSYVDRRTGLRRFFDVKGVMTERFRIITKLWALHMGFPLDIVMRRRGGFVVTRTILPKGAA